LEGLGLPVELVPRWRSLEYVSTEFSTRIPLLCVLIAEVNQVKDGLLYQCQITEDNCAGCTENYEAYSESKGRLVSKKNIFVRHIFY